LTVLPFFIVSTAHKYKLQIYPDHTNMQREISLQIYDNAILSFNYVHFVSSCVLIFLFKCLNFDPQGMKSVSVTTQWKQKVSLIHSTLLLICLVIQKTFINVHTEHHRFNVVLFIRVIQLTGDTDHILAHLSCVMRELPGL